MTPPGQPKVLPPMLTFIIASTYSLNNQTYSQIRNLRYLTDGISEYEPANGMLVIANIALKAGLMTSLETDSPVANNMYSSVVIMAVVTTLVTPILLKCVYGAKTKPASWP